METLLVRSGDLASPFGAVIPAWGPKVLSENGSEGSPEVREGEAHEVRNGLWGEAEDPGHLPVGEAPFPNQPEDLLATGRKAGDGFLGDYSKLLLLELGKG